PMGERYQAWAKSGRRGPASGGATTGSTSGTTSGSGTTTTGGTSSGTLTGGTTGGSPPATLDPSASSSVAGNLRLITPVRVVDTRTEAGGPIGVSPGGRPILGGTLLAGNNQRFLISGQTFAGFPFPSDVTGV